MLRANRECMARKRWVYSSLITSAAGHLRPPQTATPTLGPPQDKAKKSTYVLEIKNDFERAKDAVRQYVLGLLDTLKDKAFRGVFVEPTKAYFRATYDGAEGDVEVHGINTYMAILSAVLGVSIPALPFLHDSVSGVAPFAEGFMPNELKVKTILNSRSEKGARLFYYSSCVLWENAVKIYCFVLRAESLRNLSP